jgi:hypothetical protein
MSKYQIYKRKGRIARERAIRGEQYDGSKWTLVKSYLTEDDANKALRVHEDRHTRSDGSKRWQYKLIKKD